MTAIVEPVIDGVVAAPGQGAWYAVTSLTGAAGTWWIVARGDDPDSVRQAALGALVSGTGSTPLLDMGLADVRARKLVEHLHVVLRSRAARFVGAAGLQRFDAGGVRGDLP